MTVQLFPTHAILSQPVPPRSGSMILLLMVASWLAFTVGGYLVLAGLRFIAGLVA